MGFRGKLEEDLLLKALLDLAVQNNLLTEEVWRQKKLLKRLKRKRSLFCDSNEVGFLFAQQVKGQGCTLKFIYKFFDRSFHVGLPKTD